MVPSVKTLKIYATASATGNAAAQVIIPAATTIRGIQWSCMVDQIADNSRVDIELSRASASEIAVNGAQQCISQICLFNNLTTSGVGQISITTFHPVNVSVSQGQIIYMHALVTTSTYFATAIIHYD